MRALNPWAPVRQAPQRRCTRVSQRKPPASLSHPNHRRGEEQERDCNEDEYHPIPACVVEITRGFALHIQKSPRAIGAFAAKDHRRFPVGSTLVAMVRMRDLLASNSPMAYRRRWC